MLVLGRFLFLFVWVDLRLKFDNLVKSKILVDFTVFRDKADSRLIFIIKTRLRRLRISRELIIMRG